ncbi:ribonuclease III [Zopfia rhizophila CBS 207.26]|uniref:Ribonuclease III n=1 Tax=Zopfia rhizophila CBS 207.26 TaxID=1314779 RepID=A0A6A6DJS1_9PEZI|nr:ribonuclease III [Zopfia rhizophila CBS 207.26]
MANADQKIARAEQIFGHVFANKLLCAEAIQMAAPQALLAVAGAFHVIDNNKRLAVLGDIALAQALCKMWYQARNDEGKLQPPSAWTDIRNQILGNASLTRRGEEVGIVSCIVMSDGNRGLATPKMVATTFEALVGAIYEDGGEEAVIRVVEHLELNQHPFLMVTFRFLPSPRAETPRLTNMPSFRSLTRGTLGASLRRLD